MKSRKLLALFLAIFMLASLIVPASAEITPDVNVTNGIVGYDASLVDKLTDEEMAEITNIKDYDTNNKKTAYKITDAAGWAKFDELVKNEVAVSDDTNIYQHYKGLSGVTIYLANDIDFNGEKAVLNIPTFAQFDLSILEEMKISKSAIQNGCVYDDGSFNLVSHSLLTGEATTFDFTVNGVRYNGEFTGLLAYRKGEFAFATKGSELYENGVRISLDFD